MVANFKNSADDFQKILFSTKNMPTVAKIVGKIATLQGVDVSTNRVPVRFL